MQCRIQSFSLLSTVLCIILAGCDPKPVPVAPPPEVEVLPATVGPIQESITAIGETRADEKVDLVARVEGFLKKRNFKEGQPVKKGELLFEIEPEIYEAEVKSAQAGLNKSLAARKNADTDYERQSKLAKNDAVSERALDNAASRKMQADAEVEAAEAALAKARQNLSYTKIYAPFDGWIGLAPISEGNLVGRNSGTLASVVRMNPMRVEFVLNEMDLLTLLRSQKKEGAQRPEVRVQLYTQDGREYDAEGKISFWDNRIDPDSGTLRLQAIFPNPDGMLLPGMFTRIKLSPPKPREALLIPQTAVMTDQAGDYVYIVDKDGIVRRRTLKTGYRDETHIVVTGNLTPGEEVIVNGIQKVRPGMKVKAVSAKIQTPASTIPAPKQMAPKTEPAAAGNTAPADMPRR